jgi:hypothetical protein
MPLQPHLDHQPPTRLSQPTAANSTATAISSQLTFRGLREVTRQIRPDWDLAVPGLREN